MALVVIPMYPTFQPRRMNHRRARNVSPASDPAPDGVRAGVWHTGGQSFTWFFDTPFDDPTGPWTAADFAGLIVGGNLPVIVDEVIGQDGTITLIYDLPDPDAPDLQYTVFSAPAVLHFAGGKPLDVPQEGFVTP